MTNDIGSSRGTTPWAKPLNQSPKQRLATGFFLLKLNQLYIIWKNSTSMTVSKICRVSVAGKDSSSSIMVELSLPRILSTIKNCNNLQYSGKVMKDNMDQFYSKELTRPQVWINGDLDRRFRSVFLVMFTYSKYNLVRRPNPSNVGWWWISQLLRCRSVNWCNLKKDEGNLHPRSNSSISISRVLVLAKWAIIWSISTQVSSGQTERVKSSIGPSCANRTWYIA